MLSGGGLTPGSGVVVDLSSLLGPHPSSAVSLGVSLGQDRAGGDRTGQIGGQGAASLLVGGGGGLLGAGTSSMELEGPRGMTLPSADIPLALLSSTPTVPQTGQGGQGQGVVPHGISGLLKAVPLTTMAPHT